MSTASGTATPPNVERHATEKADLDRTALIGVFGTPRSLRALIRLPNGNTQTVAIGDSFAGGTVRAIAEDRLVFLRMGQQRTMRMPQN
jgi:hypothetical protein